MTPPSNEIVLHVVAALDDLKIPYMLVGSYSSNTFGIARSTQDADFVIELDQGSISPLTQRLGPDLRIDPQSSFESLTMTSRFVANHASSKFKVEFFLVKDDPFDRSRFERRQRRPFLGREAWLPTAEDVIIQKLRWFERGKRSKDLEDARNVVAVQLNRLDLPYIRQWCDQHGTRSLFERLLLESQQFEQENPP
jgi:hypothetical protein